MYSIINAKTYPGAFSDVVEYFHSKWGGSNDLPMFADAIQHANSPENGLPRFFLLLREKQIVGCCSLLVHDYVSRQDLMPWLAGLFVEESERGKSLGKLLIDFVVQEAKKLGYSWLYLRTTLSGYYEKYGWTRIEDSYKLPGEITRLYKKDLSTVEVAAPKQELAVL